MGYFFFSLSKGFFSTLNEHRLWKGFYCCYYQTVIHKAVNSQHFYESFDNCRFSVLNVFLKRHKIYLYERLPTESFQRHRKDFKLLNLHPQICFMLSMRRGLQFIVNIVTKDLWTCQLVYCDRFVSPRWSLQFLFFLISEEKMMKQLLDWKNLTLDLMRRKSFRL